MLSGDQFMVLTLLWEAKTPMSPAEVAKAMGDGRSPAGAAKTLIALYDRGLVRREWGTRTAVYTAPLVSGLIE